MQIRTPAVAGMFYPKDKKKLQETVHDSFLHSFGPGKTPPSNMPENVYGIICPHAGFNYSGPIASHSYHSISTKPIELAIIVGPNHWGVGCSVASMRDAKWETPLGLIEVDSEMAIDLANISKFVELDFFSHVKEHSIEVQIPMLQEIFSDKLKILPISLINQELEVAKDVGNAIASIAKKKNVIIIGSSDFTHYEENEFAHKQDLALIEPILRLEVEKFYSVLNDLQVSACGYGAIASTMIACKKLGATEGKLLRYATSGDITGETSSVVGYAAIKFI